MVMQRRGWLHMQNDSSDVVREIADTVSLKRFNVTSAMLSIEQRKLLLESVEELWNDLDEIAAMGRAS